MILIITDPVKGSANTWEFELGFMHGDADGYTTENWLIRHDDYEKLERAEEFLDFMHPFIGMYESREKPYDYPHFEDIFEWFGYPGDNTLIDYDDDRLANLSYVKVFWYDQDGTKFSVDVIYDS